MHSISNVENGGDGVKIGLFCVQGAHVVKHNVRTVIKQQLKRPIMMGQLYTTKVMLTSWIAM